MRWLVPSVLLSLSLGGFAIQVPLRPSTSDTGYQNSKSKASTLTPSDIVELSRPGVGIANEVGDLVLVSVSKFSVQERKNHFSVWISLIESTGEPLRIPLENGGDVFWLDNRTIGQVVSDENEMQELYAISLEVETQPSMLLTPSDPELAGRFPPGVSAANFKYTTTGERLVFSSYVWPDRSLQTVKEQDERWDNRGTSALIYDELYPRHWDHWILPKRSSLFSVKLAKDADGRWVLDDEFISVLNGTKHEVPVDSGSASDFDISSTSIVYSAKDPSLSPAEHTRRNVYIVDILGQFKPRQLSDGKKGATADPVFSKRGDKVAWTEMDEDGYESDKAKLAIYDLHKDVQFTLTEHWDRSVSGPCFSQDDENITFLVPDIARRKIFSLPVPSTPSNSTAATDFNLDPVALTFNHSASGIQFLPDGRILYTESSFISPNDVYVIEGLNRPDEPLKHRRVTSFTTEELKGKSLRSPEEFWFEGAQGRQVHGWIVLPPGYEEKSNKKWPAILWIHGGPQGIFGDVWSLSWNSVAWAHQGYVIVLINPTGSTSFGQNFTDAIKEDFGGKPFIDLKKGWQYFLDHHPQVDTERLAAAGGSYGGYAVNWIQSHPEFEFGFKALFCQDGIFDMGYTSYSTDELYFFNHDFGGKPWEPKTREIIEKFNPANFVANWSIPELITHGSKDYRLAETEAIAAFHALQQRGIPSRLIIYPDEIHGILKHMNLLSWYHEVFRWFDEFIGAGRLQT